MPMSTTSWWSRLLSWLNRSRPPLVSGNVPTSPPAVTPPPDAITPDATRTPPPSVMVMPELPTPSQPAPPPANPTPPPVLVTLTLPTEGVHLGFETLWRNHPAIADQDIFPCKDVSGNPNFGNQCGIMMGTCLLRSNLLHGYDKSICWYRGHEGHTLRAREVADWMRRHPERFGRVEIRKSVTWGAFKGRTGFVCFQNFWGDGNQGDHIDLWDGTGLIRKALDPSLEGAGMAHGGLDYFERSEEVWFWPVY